MAWSNTIKDFSNLYSSIIFKITSFICELSVHKSFFRLWMMQYSDCGSSKISFISVNTINLFVIIRALSIAILYNEINFFYNFFDKPFEPFLTVMIDINSFFNFNFLKSFLGIFSHTLSFYRKFINFSLFLPSPKPL